MIHLYEMSRRGPTKVASSHQGLGLERRGQVEEMPVTDKGYGVSLGGDETVLKLIVVMVVQLCECTKIL